MTWDIDSQINRYTAVLAKSKIRFEVNLASKDI